MTKFIKKISLISILVLLLGSVVWYYSFRSDNVDQASNSTLKIHQVTAQSFSELVDTVTLDKTATIEPVVSAPLIARLGGRITQLNVNLGEVIQVGQIAVSIDGKLTANPARAQLNAARSALTAYNNVADQALAAVDNAIATARLSVDAAQAGRTLSTAQTQKAIEQARLSVREAELSFQDAVESEQRQDQVVRVADIRLQAAKLALNQAKIAQDLATRRTKDALTQASQGLTTATQSKEKTIAELNSQRISLTGQVAYLTEQVKLSQVIAPVSGQIASLNVHRGDYVRPGEVIGEIVVFNQARLTVNVPAGVRDQLAVNQAVPIKVRGQSLIGHITHLANSSSADLSLWQIDILIDDIPSTVYPGDLAIVELPAGTTTTETVFLPLDVAVVRQNGIVIMTADSNGKVSEHIITPLSYYGHYFEAAVNLPANAMIITSGNKTLRTGDTVQFSS